MNLHKLLFPKEEEKLRLKDTQCQFLERSSKSLAERLQDVLVENKHLKREQKSPDKLENLMRMSLGLPYISFHDIETDAGGNDNPPHYLKGLDPEARKGFIAELASIYRSERFKAVMNYHINVLGNHSMQKAQDSDMRNGRIGIVALRGFRQEFEKANSEYQDTLDPDKEKFDPQEILPE